ncbi:putative riboflavin synthase subunit alpha [Candidatus Hodgkinia cicadicola Dsem]|nr:putative riboflavin synthase subunit alpha [Candidatus Hodgkinia cicadicola Dsem]
MFSGLIRVLALVESVELLNNGVKLRLLLSSKLGLNVGSSLSCNGVCLTVVGVELQRVELEVWRDALCRTTLSALSRFDVLNVEPPVEVGAPLHGFVSTGRVSCVVKPVSADAFGKAFDLKLSCPRWLVSRLSSKAGACLDGVALTLSSWGERWLRTLVIGFTARTTSFKLGLVGRELNCC